jgi:glutamyl/glutaminyl-tRNA synthetase
VQKANPTFNIDKLDWFNGQYIRKLSDDSLNERFKEYSPEFSKLEKNIQIKITALLKERVKKLTEINELANFFWKKPDIDLSLFGSNYKEHITTAIEIIENNKDYIETIKEKGYKTGDFFMDLRIAVTGMKFTPPINDSIEILGKEETLTRLRKLV